MRRLARSFALVMTLPLWFFWAGETQPAQASNPGCAFEAYRPVITSDSSQPTKLNFSAKQICWPPQEQEVCVRPQEYENGAWRNRTAGWFCKTAVGTDVYHHRAWLCSDLGHGKFRTRARFRLTWSQPVSTAYDSSAAVIRC